MGRLYKQKDSKYWWLDYYRNGRRIRESSGTTKKTVAKAILKDREGRIARGEPVSLRAERVLFDELAEDFLNDYKVNGKRSLDKAERSVDHLLKFFGGMRASQITTEDVKRYIAKRQSTPTRLNKPPANATINRELAALKRIFNLARQTTPPKIYQAPYVPTLQEDNVREGFLEPDEYQALLGALPEHLKPILKVAYHTGMRKSEILSMTWEQVSLKNRTIRLNRGQTKNRQGKVIVMTKEVYDALSGLKDQRDWNWPEVQQVFVRGGKPIKDYRKAWRSACKRVGLDGLNPHDMRRSAVRNMVRSGVPEKVAMAISGHKTRSVFDRYNIVSEQDLAQAAQALDDYHGKMGIVTDIVEAAEQILEKAQDSK
jgi:integrase